MNKPKYEIAPKRKIELAAKITTLLKGCSHEAAEEVLHLAGKTIKRSSVVQSPVKLKLNSYGQIL